ncbi:5-3 exonuclease XRNC [Trypanosoma grayi]|uniref:5-3 exonuclease XRNC n=1 Tax=Trypanosoma grayi TaxID=71804 RepID=UPI0004F48914|nr:5-3 exonuclease XRNC [Trypanosoma grayi]KEG12050.1 5-3 exonuclease XRNC [Trypanosoma grayi]
MGVPLLLTWLKRRFASCFLPSSCSPAADCLYIDVNGLVYQAAALATAVEVAAGDVDAAILRRLFDLLDDVVMRLVRPRSLVYLAVDGISPMGKLAQQRSRRRRRGGGTRGRSAVEWDSNSISVGTPFMSRLTDALHYYCASRAERINGERLRDQQRRATCNSPVEDDKKAEVAVASPIVFVVDDVWRPGEGENKIADAIRRFRSQPNYDPNTSHVICSSDTDVTVCSLILHEPRIHVLRYEYPASSTSRAEGGSWRNQVGDGWASTFFSIHAFREELREKLRLQHRSADSADEVERRSRQFERTLHDVVFVLLLFGNDFLPSVGCRIEEGFLDDLLELLATDFISRDRSIIDPATNTIQFDAARYALDCLAEMRNERDGGDLFVNNGTGGGADWGFEDDAFLQRKQAEEEAQAPRCYAYWTMLQWSLQNSAGVVEHWGCYYPYSSAPPLHLLRKYCGVLSYDALMQLAERQSHTRGGHGAPAPSTEAQNSSVSRVRGSGPTDVLVQLLVLLPARSTALLPSAVRNAYHEIEPLVLVPVERLDFAAIEAWCAEKRRLFTEEERTRFHAYALAAGSRVLASGALGEPIKGSEMIFVADWDAKELAKELQLAEKAVPVEKTTSSTSNSTPTLTSSSTGSLAASFFSSRPVRKAAASAAAIALLSTPKDNGAPVHSSSANNDENKNKVEVPVVVSQEEARHLEEVELLQGSSFSFLAAPTEVLGDVSIVKGVGAIVGDTFVCGQHSCGPLSRHPQTMRVRLRWRIASKPLLDSVRFAPDLLPGYHAPSPPPPLPSRDDTGRAGVKRTAAMADCLVDGDGDDDLPENRTVASELERKKEAVRRRIEALQARAAGGTA